MLLDFKNLDDSTRYKVMSNTIIPRPIAWIVTEDNGILNAAPFSYFAPLSSNPAVVVVSIGKKDDKTPKDTLANILKNKKATICFVNSDNLEDMKLTANPLDKDRSEISTYNIKTRKIIEEYPPMISSSESALFCDFHSKIELNGKTTPIILEIKKQFVLDESISKNYHISLNNIARCGSGYKKLLE